MNNEIKEILDYYRNIVNDKKETYTVISKDTIYLEHLLDYITNLQQENNNLKTSLDESQEVVIDLQQRIEKAVEYIEHSKFIKEQVIMRSNYDMQDFQIRELLNILRGKDNE